MKHFFLLLLTALALISCSDDSDPVTPAASITVYSPKKVTVYTTSNDTKVYNFTYDTKGNVLTENCDSVSRKTYTYDARGNCIAIFSEYYSNGWQEDYNTICTFDAKNNMLSRVTTEIYGETISEYYIYDSNNNLLTETKEYYPHSASSFQQSYTYNSNNQVLSTQFASLASNVWTVCQRSSYSYNEQGKLVEILTETLDSDTYQNDYRLLNTYSAAGDLLISQYQDWSDNGSWINGTRNNFSYDNQHNITSQYFEYFQGGNWVNETKTDYKYNTNNLVTEQENFSRNGASWEHSYRTMLIKHSDERVCSFSCIGYKMTVEYASFQVPATNSSAATAVSLPELVPHEMIERLAPYNNHKRN